METLFLIVVNVIFPIFLVMTIGAFLHRVFKFHMNTLSKVATYFLLPAVAFVNIYQSEISVAFISQILSFLILQSLLLMVFCEVISRVMKLEQSMAATFKNSIVLNNSGNFGIPVSQLVFMGNPVGVSIQMFVMIYQNLLTFTYGLFNCVAVEQNRFKALLELFKLPILYALILGLILNFIEINLPHFIFEPISNIASAFFSDGTSNYGSTSGFFKNSSLFIFTFSKY